MSGGRYEHKQFILLQIAEELSDDLGDKHIDCNIDEYIKRAVSHLEIAYDYIHEIDYLLSGDTGCEGFEERLMKRLESVRDGLEY